MPAPSVIRRLLSCAPALLLTAVAVLPLPSVPRLAAEEQMRVVLSDAQAEDLGQEERWALQECQAHVKAKRWQAGSLAFRRFCDQFPESKVWMYAVLSEAWCLRQEAKLNSAIDRLDEVLKLDPGAPEVPELLLLQGSCWQEQGEVARGQRCLQKVVADFPKSAAAVPARLRLDDYLVQAAAKDPKKSDPDQLAAARIALLAPSLVKPAPDRLSGWTYARISERLRDLYLGAGRYADALAMTQALAPFASRGVPDFDINGFIADLHRRVVGAALWRQDEALLTQTAASAWPDPAWRAVELGRVRADFLQSVLGDAETRKKLAKDRGVNADQLANGAHEQAAAAAQQIQEQAPQLRGGARDEAGWTAVRLRLLAVWPAPAGQPLDVAGALAALDVFGRDLNSGDVRRFSELCIQHGARITAIRGAAERVPEGPERSIALLQALEIAAYRSGDGNDRKLSAQEGIALAAKLEGDDQQRAPQFLSLQARLQEEILGDYEQAIVSWTKLNQPPSTEFAIARCLEKAGKFKEAFLRLGGVYAANPGTGEAATALLWQGRMAFERLGDKPKAVALLRQVCDEFPDSGQYNEAHQYLQGRLDVVYTGGGGKRAK